MGETTITASYKGRTDTIKLKVVSPFKTFTISPGGLMELVVGDDAKTITASGGLALTGSTSTPDPSDMKWFSSSTAVATVDNGEVTAVGTGTAAITASYLGSTATITVVVRPAFEAMRISPKEEQHLSLKDNSIIFTLKVVNSNEDLEDVSTQAVWTSSNVFAATVDIVDGQILVTLKASVRQRSKVPSKGHPKRLP